MKTLAGYTFWDYRRLPDRKLKELLKDSPNQKIQSICNSKSSYLSVKQKMCLAIYLDSKGEYDDYTYLIKLKEINTKEEIMHPPLNTNKEQEEIWKPIEGFAGYEVSNQGSVRKFLKSKNIWITRKLNKNNGYYIIDLFLNNIRRTKKVHRLVAQAFIPNPENKPQVNHINGTNKMDNRVENLEWCTASENNFHAYRTGLKKQKQGAKSSRTKPVMVIDKDGNHVLTIYGVKECKKYGFDSSHVSKCCLGKIKTHKGYTFRYIDKDSSL
jgi:hypothetical protein